MQRTWEALEDSSHGHNRRDNIMRLHQPVHLLVGTPGRILDLAKGICILKDCSMLIMDEVHGNLVRML